MFETIKKIIDKIGLAFRGPAVAPVTMANSSKDKKMTDEQRAEMKRLLDDAEKRLKETHERRLAVINRLRQQLDRRGMEALRQEITE
ncbi:hypothetical protein ACFL26_00585 [Patescibacteria group bacterium]